MRGLAIPFQRTIDPCSLMQARSAAKLDQVVTTPQQTNRMVRIGNGLHVCGPPVGRTHNSR